MKRISRALRYAGLTVMTGVASASVMVADAALEMRTANVIIVIVIGGVLAWGAVATEDEQ